jgi:prophage antirepressor-like protein
MNSQGSTAIQAFVFPETNQKVRVFVDEDGTLWFVAADVCRMLGYVTVYNAITRHCKPDGTAKRSTIDNILRQKDVTVINEANLYRLISRSNAPNAEPFQDWVSEEVLPLIRKTGSYGHNSQQQFDLTNLDPDAMIETLLTIQQQRKQEKARQLGCGSTTSPTFPRTSHTASTPVC